MRIKPGAEAADDLEPEYIAVAKDGSTAWTTGKKAKGIPLQETPLLKERQKFSPTIGFLEKLGYSFNVEA